MFSSVAISIFSNQGDYSLIVATFMGNIISCPMAVF